MIPCVNGGVGCGIVAAILMQEESLVWFNVQIQSADETILNLEDLRKIIPARHADADSTSNMARRCNNAVAVLRQS